MASASSSSTDTSCPSSIIELAIADPAPATSDQNEHIDPTIHPGGREIRYGRTPSRVPSSPAGGRSGSPCRAPSRPRSGWSPPRSGRAPVRGLRGWRRRAGALGSSAPSTIASTPRRLASETIAWPTERPRTIAVATSTPAYSSPTSLARAAPASPRARAPPARARRSGDIGISKTYSASSTAPPSSSSLSDAASRPAVPTMSSSSSSPNTGTRMLPYSARALLERLGRDREALRERLALAARR